MLASFAYLTYWANHQYLVGNWSGRLNGPSSITGSGIYQDQNDFAMAFVVAQPFFWFFGSARKTKLARWICWLIIPLSWNAVFLTGSRGGFVGVTATIFIIAMRSRRKLLGLALIPVFLLVFLVEGGPVMTARVNGLDQYQVHRSVQDRFHSWQAAERMIEANPITGVGLASYGPAFPYYSHHHPREAHDTLLQITAESGVFAGAMYLLIVLSLICSLWKNGSQIRREGARNDALLMMNEASMVGFMGLVVCSIFLSLQEFEIFYCLNVLGNSVLYLSRRKQMLAARESDVIGQSALNSSQ